MTFSIEPGIYLPDRTGVRIEDLAWSLRTVSRSSTAYPHDPVRLDRQCGKGAVPLPHPANDSPRKRAIYYV